ncbi:hypothetical protein P8C59_000301 [Phyllachora maydis]|uniref:PDZ GRASP-type domain-containing protein n=1 Tax=Phyllachora maydis TaxID=1825666 RepID=A0AAD9HXD3_9PEZI|nr:hypothetical protein P8C59_000301 [Phyllachora maydis]
MFNALNRFISRLDGDAPTDHKDSQSAFGFQVLRNGKAPLAIEPWFDYVVGINGRMIDDSDPRLFAQEVRNCAGGQVMLGLWSAKGQRTRALHVPVPADTGSLGLALQWTPLSVGSNIWHVLEVPANSPADVAGLLPFSDYILGTPEGVLHGESGLGELVEDYIGRPLRLWVYNHEYDVTREVTIQPSRDWGGQGALGCVLGYGALHRLPAPLSEPVHAPGETLFEADDEKAGSGISTQSTNAAAAAGGDFFVPAQMAETGPPAGGGPPKAGKKKDRHAHNANPLMDDYFKEQEQKSRELESTTGRKASPLPPPPKTGPPPPKGGPPPTETPPTETPPTEMPVPVELLPTTSHGA